MAEIAGGIRVVVGEMHVSGCDGRLEATADAVLYPEGQDYRIYTCCLLSQLDEVMGVLKECGAR